VNKAKKWKSRGSTPRHKARERCPSLSLSLGQNRRMSKDYERLCTRAEAFVYAAMIRLMVRRLARG
jgi:transposase